jgi:indolepyruvate ferredoxin oxidoreductase, alpha subunit
MAERSFEREVRDLRLRAGEIFRGEGILAITKALLQSGVSYVAGYQGSPISHLMDVLADAQDVMSELGVHFETSASEAAAAATLSASVMYPARGAVTWKSTAGTNVAADALSNLSSGGVIGGALIIIGEDYGEGSSIMQERSHAYAMKSQIWLLDPRPDLPTLVRMVEQGFELSEASNSPVMLEVRIRTCHVHGAFVAKDNRKPAFALSEALEHPSRDVNRIVLPPASFMQEKEKLEKRWPAAVEFIKARKLNEFFGPKEGQVGIVTLGGLFNGTLRALEQLGLADVYGASSVPVYVLNVAYPIVEDEVIEFCRGKQAILMVEEGAPDYLEQAVNTVLRRRDMQTKVAGKDVLPMGGEYTAPVMVRGVRAFLAAHAPELLRNQPPVPDPAPILAHEKVKALAKAVPPRPPGFCVGCPERPIFAALKLVEQELGPHHVSADIGCHLFSILPPFNIGATTMGYGLGPASASAFNVKAKKRVLSIMGDGGFWHNGLLSGVASSMFNRGDRVLVIMQNGYTSATGAQFIPNTAGNRRDGETTSDIAATLKAMGVKWLRTIRTYNVGTMLKTLREAMSTDHTGLKVIVADGECQLARQRRVRPQIAAQLKRGERVVRTRFGVDDEVCTGDHSCIRLSGCPSLVVKPSPDPLRSDPVAHVNNGCVGCGLCGEVADAAVLCPSFYKADIVQNPSWWDQLVWRLRSSVIGAMASG